jgi:uncharacterized oxidoreductase
MRTTGNTILITGGGTGMGLAAAKAFSERGNKVIMVARNEERLRAEAARLRDADPVACDISDAGQVDALMKHVAAEHPDLNMLFLNAGVTHTYRLFDREDMYAHARQEMEINYLSVIRLTQRFEPILAGRPDPAIIITTSGVIYAPDVTNPTYSASKAALHSFIQSARFLLEKKGSKIKLFELIAPLVDTRFAAEVQSDEKVSPASVIHELLAGLEADRLDIRPGMADDFYRAWRESPEKAFDLAVSATGA